jgi:hypothetical protein
VTSSYLLSSQVHNIVNVPLMPLWRDPLFQLDKVVASVQAGTAISNIAESESGLSSSALADLKRLAALLHPQGMVRPLHVCV